MRRLIHTRGRRRSTHCETCGRPLSPAAPVLGTDNRRLMHLHFAACRYGSQS